MSEIKKLQLYDKAYAKGKPLVSDIIYDKLYAKAKKLYPNDPYFKKVGAKLTDPTDNKRKEVTLPFMMGSLHKKRPKQIVDWLQKLPKNTEYVMSPKMDGVAIVLEYIDGKLYKAYTRGEDGITGFDVTKNIKYVQGALFKITRKAKHSPIKGTLYVKAECIIHTSLFKKYYAKSAGGKYSTPRSFVVGQINRLKLESENIKALKKMTLVAYGMHRNVNGKDVFHAHKISEINQLAFMGFTTWQMPTRWIEKTWKQYRVSKTLDEKDYPPQQYKDLPIVKFSQPKLADLTVDYLNEIIKLWRDSKDIDIQQDGIVIEIVSHEQRKKLDFGESRPGYAFAVKPETEDQVIKIGVIDHIEWSLTSRKLLKPVVVLKKSLDFNGVMVSRISGNNAKFVKLHKLIPGVKVRVIHSGDVIPRVLGHVKSVGK